MNVRRGIGIKAAYFTTAMEADSFPPQAPATTGKASATESGERDLFAESPPPVAGGPERRLAAGLGRDLSVGGQALPPDRRKPTASRRSGAPPVATTEAGTVLETADPVFQKALEILRREKPPPPQAQNPISEVHSPESAIQAPRSEGAATLRTPHSEPRTRSEE